MAEEFCECSTQRKQYGPFLKSAEIRNVCLHVQRKLAQLKDQMTNGSNKCSY